MTTAARRRAPEPEVVRIDFTDHLQTITAVATERVRRLSVGARRTRVNGWEAAFEDARRGLVAEVAVSTYLGGRIDPWQPGRSDGGVDVRVGERLRIGVKSSSYAANRSHLYVAEWDRVVCDAYVLVPVRGYEAFLLGWAPRAAVRAAPLGKLTPKGPLNRIVPCAREGCYICGGGDGHAAGLFPMGKLLELATNALRIERGETA